MSPGLHLSHGSTKTMRRSYKLLIAGSATLLAFACSDAPTTPMQVASGPVALANRNDGGDSFSADFTLTPSGGSYSMTQRSIGTWTLTVPAGAVSKRIDATVTVVTSGSRVYVVVSQEDGGHIVFKAGKAAVLETTLDAATLRQARSATSLNVLAILYSSSVGGPLNADEPTHLDLRTGRLWREVTHFSGYSVHSGRWIDCSVTPNDPECPLPGDVIAN